MGLSKTEVNLRRLLAVAPLQPNDAKLLHYVATLRELLEHLAQEMTPQGLPRVPKATVSDYSDKIEAIASKLASQEATVKNCPSVMQEDQIQPLPGLRKRPVLPSNVEAVKLDAVAQAHIAKHRNLQENLTDEMLELAQQLKESSLVMGQSVQNAGKILDSTETSIERSLAGTSRVNKRAVDIYSKSFNTSCFSWLVVFVMACIFIMVVLLIRVT